MRTIRRLAYMVVMLSVLSFGVGLSNQSYAQDGKQAQKESAKEAKKLAEANRKAAEARARQEAKDNKLTQAMRDVVSTNGVGEKAKLELQLRDNTKLQGWVSQLSMNDFTLNDGAGQPRTIAYSEVAKAKGKNPAAGKKKSSGWMTALAMIP